VPPAVVTIADVRWNGGDSVIIEFDVDLDTVTTGVASFDFQISFQPVVEIVSQTGPREILVTIDGSVSVSDPWELSGDMSDIVTFDGGLFLDVPQTGVVNPT